MTDCALTLKRIDGLLSGALPRGDREALIAHLTIDCGHCDAAIDAAGLDEETLLVALFGAAQRERAPRVRARAARFAAVICAVTAAAAILLAVQPPPDDGRKGRGEAPCGALRTVLVEEREVELRYDLDRPAWAQVWCLWEDSEWQLLFAGRVEASDDAPFSLSGGRLGYSLNGESGAHVFVLAVGDLSVEPAHVRDELRRAWLLAAPEPLVRSLDGVALRLYVARVVAPEGQP